MVNFGRIYQRISKLWPTQLDLTKSLFLPVPGSSPAERRERFGSVSLNQSRLVLSMYRKGYLTSGDELIIIYD